MTWIATDKMPHTVTDASCGSAVYDEECSPKSIDTDVFTKVRLSCVPLEIVVIGEAVSLMYALATSQMCELELLDVLLISHYS